MCLFWENSFHTLLWVFLVLLMCFCFFISMIFLLGYLFIYLSIYMYLFIYSIIFHLFIYSFINVFCRCWFSWINGLFSSSRLRWAFLIKICSLSVVIVAVVAVNFTHFHLLQNRWADFNQAWHKASLSTQDSSLFK